MKKHFTKALALILALVLLFPLMCGALTTDASAEEPAYAKYPTVLIHGFLGWAAEDYIDYVMPYWGMTSGDMVDYMRSLGADVYAASVGPLSSCWDRCCELFAQMTGTRTDYGQAHCDQAVAEFKDVGCPLGHERYGRDYTGNPLFEGWGPIYKNGKVTGWYDNKVNLVGHSFGGPTSTYFLYLLEEGDAAERDWAKQQAKAKGGDWHDYCSPLFWGDYNGKELVNCIVSLAGVLNGTTFIDACDHSAIAVTTLMDLMANAIGGTPFNGVYDFQLEQFGITKSNNPDYHYTLDFIRSAKFLDGYDNALWDLSIPGCNVLKRGWECYDNVYYYAYAGDTTSPDPLTGHELPNPNTWFMFIPFAQKMGYYTNPNEVVTDIYGNKFCVIDEKWLPNDGMVNTITASYVFGCPHKDWDGNAVPGLWMTMPNNGYDHMDYGGGMLEPTQNSVDTKAFYREVLNDIALATLGSSSAFKDVSASSPYATAINWAAEKGIAKGYDSNTFAPNDSCTRAQVVSFLWRAAGCPAPKTAKCPFVDVDKQSPHYQAILWASEKGITEGFDATHFKPNDTVTRAQFVTFLWRYEGKPAVKGSCPFVDVDSASPYYKAILWASKEGVTLGYDATHFQPNTPCSRGQVVTFIYRDMA